MMHSLLIYHLLVVALMVVVGVVAVGQLEVVEAAGSQLAVGLWRPNGKR